MKLVEKSLMMDDATFAPKIRITIDFPIETLQEGSIQLSDNEFAEIIGLELLMMLREKNETN